MQPLFRLDLAKAVRLFLHYPAQAVRDLASRSTMPSRYIRLYLPEPVLGHSASKCCLENPREEPKTNDPDRTYLSRSGLRSLSDSRQPRTHYLRRPPTRTFGDFEQARRPKCCLCLPANRQRRVPARSKIYHRSKSAQHPCTNTRRYRLREAISYPLLHHRVLSPRS